MRVRSPERPRAGSCFEWSLPRMPRMPPPPPKPSPCSASWTRARQSTCGARQRTRRFGCASTHSLEVASQRAPQPRLQKSGRAKSALSCEPLLKCGELGARQPRGRKKLRGAPLLCARGRSGLRRRSGELGARPRCVRKPNARRAHSAAQPPTPPRALRQLQRRCAQQPLQLLRAPQQQQGEGA